MWPAYHTTTTPSFTQTHTNTRCASLYCSPPPPLPNTNSTPACENRTSPRTVSLATSCPATGWALLMASSPTAAVTGWRGMACGQTLWWGCLQRIWCTGAILKWTHPCCSTTCRTSSTAHRRVKLQLGALFGRGCRDGWSCTMEGGGRAATNTRSCDTTCCVLQHACI